MISDCPGAQRFKQPTPETITCWFCQGELEIWTDEFQTTCPKCKKIVTRPGEQCCLDWCAYARECVGDEVYNRYLKSRSGGKERS